MQRNGLGRACLLGFRLGCFAAAAAGGGATAAPPAGKAGPAVVRVVGAGDGYRLTRDGKPYVIKGAGGDGPAEALSAAGGNSLRTWAADKTTGATLDQAQSLGLTVTVGFWLGHERHGFNYNDADQVARQYDEARRAVLRFKDHPALLIWAVGNEMEGVGKGDNAAIWSAVNNIASMAKGLDPNHPTMTVIAEVGGDKVRNIHRLCPDIDIVGINSYGGAPSIPARYRAAGGTKPYVLTEYGPPGPWEVKKTPWGAAPEMTSTEKAEFYRNVYQTVAAADRLCLGSYAFTWGAKQEATATWYGLFLADGSRTGGIDALTELWSGKAPADRCPTASKLTLSGPDPLEPGATVRVSVTAADPEGGPLKARWVLAREGSYGSGGDAEAAPPSVPGAVLKADARGAEVRMPTAGGGYRLYAYLHDARGNAATANVPLFVKGPAAPPSAGKVAKLPLVVYDEADRESPPYTPSGYMGNTKAITLREDSPESPHSGKTCIRVDYRAKDGWGGVVWQSPPNDWGDAPGGLDLTGAKRLTFWARGAKGGEAVGFKFGLLGREKPFFDTASGGLDRVTLTADWKRYAIDLPAGDLTRIKTGFCWSLAAGAEPVTFFLDDVRYE